MSLEFGSLLRVYRLYWGLTQNDMAQLLWMSQPVYSRIESGKKTVSMAFMERVAAQCGISKQTLILAHLLLDKNLETIDQKKMDPAQKSLIRLADEIRRPYPASFPDAAALGLLIAGAPEDQRINPRELLGR